ncbi:MAG: GGDEF domain-containing protein [Gammaproteobacteria bacterium]|nr:GGDEF domain-containing protein [Gammaproteobacteria bacterium]
MNPQKTNRRQDPYFFEGSANLVINNNQLGHSNPSGNTPAPHSELSHQLFKTLKIETQIDLISRAIQQHVPHCSIRYQNSALELDLILGKNAAHHQEFNLQIEKTPLGTISISRKKTFYDAEIEQIETLLYQLRFPLRNAVTYRHAQQSAFRDALTGANNRTSLEQLLPREIKLSQRHNTPISLLVVDLDHFKNINDRFGHSAGDTLLREITHIFHRYLRDTDLIFRYGGDEFVIALSNTDQEGAQIVAERIQQGVANSQFILKNMTVNISVSIGLTQIYADDDLNSAFCRADEGLYQAKRQGRNAVVPL